MLQKSFLSLYDIGREIEGIASKVDASFLVGMKEWIRVNREKDVWSTLEGSVKVFFERNSPERACSLLLEALALFVLYPDSVGAQGATALSGNVKLAVRRAFDSGDVIESAFYSVDTGLGELASKVGDYVETVDDAGTLGGHRMWAHLLKLPLELNSPLLRVDREEIAGGRARSSLSRRVGIFFAPECGPPSPTAEGPQLSRRGLVFTNQAFAISTPPQLFPFFRMGYKPVIDQKFLRFCRRHSNPTLCAKLRHLERHGRFRFHMSSVTLLRGACKIQGALRFQTEIGDDPAPASFFFGMDELRVVFGDDALVREIATFLERTRLSPAPVGGDESAKSRFENWARPASCSDQDDFSLPFAVPGLRTQVTAGQARALWYMHAGPWSFDGGSLNRRLQPARDLLSNFFFCKALEPRSRRDVLMCSVRPAHFHIVEAEWVDHVRNSFHRSFILCDQTGTGKTLQALLWVATSAKRWYPGKVRHPPLLQALLPFSPPPSASRHEQPPYVVSPSSSSCMMTSASIRASTECASDGLGLLRGGTLVLTPGHLLEQWRAEIRKHFADSMTASSASVVKDVPGYAAYSFTDAHIPPATRKFLVDSDVVVVSTNLFSLDKFVRIVNHVVWENLIIDEAHLLESFQQIRTKNAASVLAHNRLLLTATPYRNWRVLARLSGLTKVSPSASSNLHFSLVVDFLAVRGNKNAVTERALTIDPVFCQLEPEQRGFMDAVHREFFNLHERLHHRPSSLPLPPSNLKKVARLLMALCTETRLDYALVARIITALLTPQDRQEDDDSRVKRRRLAGGGHFLGVNPAELPRAPRPAVAQAGDDCCVCLEPFLIPVQCDPCDHVLCTACVQALSKPSCPLCRAEIAALKAPRFVSSSEPPEAAPTDDQQSSTTASAPTQPMQEEAAIIGDRRRMRTLETGLRDPDSATTSVRRKVAALVREVARELREPSCSNKNHNNNNNKTVVFLTKKRNLREYVSELARGIGAEAFVQAGVLGMGRKQTSLNLQKFARDSSVRVLLATEDCATGLDLQCANVVFIPEIIDVHVFVQQVGRVKRLGQQHDMRIVPILYENTFEDFRYSLMQGCSNRDSLNPSAELFLQFDHFLHQRVAGGIYCDLRARILQAVPTLDESSLKTDINSARFEMSANTTNKNRNRSSIGYYFKDKTWRVGKVRYRGIAANLIPEYAIKKALSVK